MTKLPIISVNFLVRVISLFFLGVSITICAIKDGGIPDVSWISLCLLAATSAVSFPPCGGESRAIALGSELFLAIAVLLCILLGAGVHLCELFVVFHTLIQTLVLCCHGLWSGRRLFTARTSWLDLTNYGRLVHTAVFITLALMSVISEPVSWLACLTCVLIALFYFFMLRKAASGRTFLMPRSRETDIRNPYPAKMSPAGDHVSDSRRLYDLAVQAMEKDQDYLDAGFCLTVLARKLGTNRTYLSRVINDCSGKSFRQFVNQFRVEYVASEIRSGSGHILIRDLAEMVGYNSPETLKSAFKLVYGKTPSEYQQEVMARRLVRRPSIQREQER